MSNSLRPSTSAIMLLATFKAKLQSAKVPVAGSGSKYFVPEGYLREIVTVNDIVSVVSDSVFEIPQHKRESTADAVFEDFLKVFSILVDINSPQKLSSFIESDVLDQRLPLDEGLLKTLLPQAWANFKALQWEHLAYRFRKGQYQIKLGPERVLPFVDQEDLGRGGYSTVYKVTIHPTHQALVPEAKQQAIKIVRKELSRSGQNDQYEAELLFLLGSLKHPNIIELLGAYKQNGITSLFFPLADMDLETFLRGTPRADEFKHDTAYFKALQGLCSGLAYLHKFKPRPQDESDDSGVSMHGYHHDIKPKNILVRGGTFILADFGSSKLKKFEESTQTRWKETTFEYGAPECRDPVSWKPGKVGRALDIWSIGCIMLEVYIHMERGPEGIRKFRESRILEGGYIRTSCFHDGEKMSDNVDGFLKVSTEQASSTASVEILSLVRRTLSEDPSIRPKAEQVEQKLVILTISEYLDLLMKLIGHWKESATCLSDKALYQTRLHLEEDRLLAWAVVLGFRKMFGRQREYDQQIYISFTEFLDILERAIVELEAKQEFESGRDHYDLVLNTLIHTNDELCMKLSRETNASIDKSFSLIATSLPKEDPGHMIERLGELQISSHLPQPHHDVTAMASMKHMSILMSKGSLMPAHDNSIEGALIRKDNKKSDPDVCPQVYWYSYGFEQGQEKKVLVESKGYSIQRKAKFGTPEFEEIGKALFKRVKDLTSMLMHGPKPANFPVLHCLGAFHKPDEQRFGIVYDFPSGSVASVRLHKLLRLDKKQEVYPDLAQKFGLAKILTTAVYNYHASGWLHRNISSNNVLFFMKTDARRDLDLATPHVIGFHHSRKAGPDEYTEGPEALKSQQEYLHPDYRMGQSGFRKSYDYYSLGLVLLEIGTWSSLRNIYSKKATLPPHQLREEYFKFCDNDLQKTMGPIYHSVTKRCLRFGEGRESEDDSRAQLDFQIDVISQLDKCVV